MSLRSAFFCGLVLCVLVFGDAMNWTFPVCGFIAGAGVFFGIRSSFLSDQVFVFFTFPSLMSKKICAFLRRQA
jgi:hypothetical protein